MKRRSSLFALSVLVLALACENSQQATGLKVHTDPSNIIDDGAHGGNQDFFFLPPLVPLPTIAQGLEIGQLNKGLRPNLTVEICRLKPDKLDNLHLPTPATPCYENGPFYRFGAGNVSLVNDPNVETGWWTGQNLSLPTDGFFYVRWDTRDAQLNAEKFYRVKVFIAGSPEPLGVVDIDPMKRSTEFQQTRMTEVVQVLVGTVLPIPFRVENRALCGGASQCTSEIVTNDGGTVTVDGGGGSTVAGARFPEGWLPAGGPQSVVVTIREVPSGENESSRTRLIPCHVGLPFQQFNKCFEFSTIPELADITPGVQFAADVEVGVCYTLFGSTDARRDYAELYASGPDEPPHALEEVSEFGLVSADARDCTPPPIITLGNSDPLTRLASALRTIKGGLGQLFGVKTAYAVDGGLGGIVKGFSNIGVALTAEIEAYPHAEPEPATTALTLVEGMALARARIVGSHSHDPEDEGFGSKSGIDDVPVTFTVSSGNGTLSDGEVDGLTQVIVATSTLDQEISGIAEVFWTPPTVPGVYTLKAKGATKDEVTFTVTVSPQLRMISMQTGASIQFSANPPDVVATWLSSAPTKVQVSPTGLVTALVGGENSNGGDDATITSVLTMGSAGPTWLVNTPFTIFPRTTTAVWAPVTGAASYDFESEFGNGCTGYANCGTWSPEDAATGIAGSSTSFTFDFVGTQPGRWRVTARDATGAIIGGTPSAWVFFRYIDGL